MRKVFADVSRPVIDNAVGGEKATLVAPHPWRDPSLLFSTTFRPVCNTKGRIVGAMGVSSPVTVMRDGGRAPAR
ncbi:MAG: hypothetical protein R3D67_01805 [Hyphomicrobiaceae bacterium]